MGLSGISTVDCSVAVIIGVLILIAVAIEKRRRTREADLWKQEGSVWTPPYGQTAVYTEQTALLQPLRPLSRRLVNSAGLRIRSYVRCILQEPLSLVAAVLRLSRWIGTQPQVFVSTLYARSVAMNRSQLVAAVAAAIAADISLNRGAAHPFHTQVALTNRSQLVAAVAAAIASNMGTEPQGLRIHSIRPVGAATNRSQLVAAISAAVATHMGTDVTGLRIHSIRKVS